MKQEVAVLNKIKNSYEKVVGLHCTNFKASWKKSGPYTSTGFLERILKEGFLPYSNFGVGSPLEIRNNFLHHGLRTNKNKVRGFYSIPGFLVVDLSGLSYQKGYDAKNHIQVNSKIDSYRIMGYFEFDPYKVISNNKLEDSKDNNHLFTKYPFLKELLLPKYDNYFLSELNNILYSF